MTAFLAAIVFFLVVHIVPPLPPVRTRLIGAVGRRAYIAAYSVVSLAAIAWIVLAAQRAPYVPLWDPAPWQALVPVVVMPFAAWLFVAGLAEPNLLSVSLRAAHPESAPGPAVAVTRHPLLWAFFLWAASHMPPNGDLVALILFGGMALLALGGMATSERRARRRLGEGEWRARAASTSVVPFAALLAGRAKVALTSRLVTTTAVALAAYGWFLLQGHALLIGPDPLGWLAP